jgi:uncharacterized membrane protein
MSVLRNLREGSTGVLALLVLGLGLADLWLDVVPGVPFWAIFAIGYAVVLPLVAIALDEDEEADESDAGRDTATEDASESPLDRLKRRYADGEIDEAEFERRLERLLETEDESAAAGYVERTRREPET